MRFKALSGMGIVLLTASVLAAATAPQLTAVDAQTTGSGGQLAIKADAAFTHTEYRPSDHQLIIDLPGVSAATLAGHAEMVHIPGVEGFRVQSFTGTGGAQVARIEVALLPGALVKLEPQGTSLMLKTSMRAANAAVVTKPAAIAATPAAPAARLSGVNVEKSATGVDLQFGLSGHVTPAVTRMYNPDRIVVDLPGVVSDKNYETVPVGTAGVRDVRIARNQMNPPLTRVVADLDAPRQFELVSEGDKLVLKLHPAGSAPVAASASTIPATASAAPAHLSAPVRASAMQAAAPARAGFMNAVARPALEPTIVTPQFRAGGAHFVQAVQRSSEAVNASTDAADTATQKPSERKVEAVRPTENATALKVTVQTPSTLGSIAPATASTTPVLKGNIETKAVAQVATPKAAEAPVSKVVANATPTPQKQNPVQTQSTVGKKSDAVPASTQAPVPVVEKKADAPAHDLLASNTAPTPLADQTRATPVQDVIVMHPQPKVTQPEVKNAPAPKQEIASATTAPVMAPVRAQEAAAPAKQSAAQPAQQQVVMQAAAGSCNVGRYTGEPISVNLKEVDLRDFFRLIHDISGLNIVLDPEVKGSLTIVLDDVPWDQALNIVLKNNRLDCQLEGNVLRVASLNTLKTEAEERVKEHQAQAEAVDQTTVTRYLSYATAKDVLPVLKQFLSTRGKIIADDRTNSLVIEDIPTTIPNLDRLIRELDRKSQQVEIEARVVATTRNFSRDIGTAVGFGWGNGVNTAIGGNPQVGNSPTQTFIPGHQWATSSASSGNTAGQAIPLFSNLLGPGATSGLALTNATRAYRLDFLLSLAEERGMAKILSRPRVITQNNISAVVRQGVRIPTVTQAQLSGPPTVTYTDAFLRLTVKPQITAEGTIFLNVDVENTTANFDKQVQGNPTLNTQQATTQVLVRDGGTVVIGGVIQTNNSTNIQQTPLLGSVPVLGNLFKRTSVSTQTQELIFFITPKIIEN